MFNAQSLIEAGWVLVTRRNNQRRAKDGLRVIWFIWERNGDLLHQVALSDIDGMHTYLTQEPDLARAKFVQIGGVL